MLYIQPLGYWDGILVQVTIYRRLRIGRDGHLDQSEAYDISQLVRKYGPCISLLSVFTQWPASKECKNHEEPAII